ncbi:MAG: DUF1289 domain-containing protein [Pseudomonadota bacterium]
MSDQVWKRHEVESPCVKICVVHPQAGICVGCHRSVEEIGRWSAMTPEERRRIMDELDGRRALLREAANRPSRRRAGKSSES